jgi:hypothetical protein
MWLIAFAAEMGDVVSRALPHGIFDTSREFPEKSGLVCAWIFFYLSGSVGGAWGTRFIGEPASLTLLRCKYKETDS